MSRFHQTLLRVLRRLGALDRFNFELSHSSGYKIPIRNRLGMGHFWGQETWMKDVLSLVLRGKRGTFIDVGVNEGQTLLALRCLDQSRPYLGFEPNPACVHYVRELLSLNRLSEVAIVPAALSDRESILELMFFTEQESDSSASIVPNFREGGRGRGMQVCTYAFETLRSSLPWASEVAAIKIDVEGAELEVLKGMQGILAEQRPHLILEVLPAYEAGSVRHQRQLELCALVQSLGYAIDRIVKSSPLRLERIDSFGVHGEVDWSDYILWPQERLST